LYQVDGPPQRGAKGVLQGGVAGVAERAAGSRPGGHADQRRAVAGRLRAGRSEPALARLAPALRGDPLRGPWLGAADRDLDPGRQPLQWSDAVGPLSGKTIVAVVVWLVAWAILYAALRTRPYETRRALAGPDRAGRAGGLADVLPAVRGMRQAASPSTVRPDGIEDDSSAGTGFHRDHEAVRTA